MSFNLKLKNIDFSCAPMIVEGFDGNNKVIAYKCNKKEKFIENFQQVLPETEFKAVLPPKEQPVNKPECPDGFTKSADFGCIIDATCPAGTTLIKGTNGGIHCVVCPANTKMDRSGKCQPASYWCRPGYTFDSLMNCVCPSGTETNAAGGCVCNNGGMFTSSGKCVCQGGKVVNQKGICSCPAGLVPDKNGMCVCAPGTVADDTGKCIIPCPEDKVKDTNGNCVCKNGLILDKLDNCIPDPKIIERQNNRRAMIAKKIQITEANDANDAIIAASRAKKVADDAAAREKAMNECPQFYIKNINGDCVMDPIVEAKIIAAQAAQAQRAGSTKQAAKVS